MIVVKTLRIQVAEVGGLETKWVDVGFFEPIAEHFWEGFLVRDFDDGDAAGFQDAAELVHNFLHVAEMVSGTNHHEGVERIISEGKIVNVAGLGLDFVAVEVFGLGKLSFGIVEEGGGFCAVQVFVGEATIAASYIDKSIHSLRKETADGEAVSHVFVFAVGIFPENLFIIIAIIISNNFFIGSFAGGLRGFAGGFCARIRVLG